MTGRTLLLALVTFTLLLIGLTAINGIVLALALPLMVYLAAAILFNPSELRLSAERSLSIDKIYPGNPVKVTLVIRNEGDALEEMHIIDQLPPGVTVIEGETELFTGLGVGEEAHLEYTLQADRGDYRFTNVRVTARESFGLFQRETLIQASHRLSVRPRPVRLKPIRIRPPQTRGFAGPIPARQGGAGVDFFIVREYQPGDPLRRMNWKLSTHGANEMFTNVYEQERVADVGIILDAREQSYGDLDNHPLFERAVQATASLAEGYLNEGNRVGVLVYGGGIESAFPGTGKIQRQRILQLLSRAHTGRNFALESLRYLPTRFFPPRSQVILISPLMPADVETLVSLRANGYSVLVLSPDLIRFEAGKVEPGSRGEAALRLALAERALMLQKARRAGAQIIDWDVSLPLESLTRRFAVLNMANAHILEGNAS